MENKTNGKEQTNQKLSADIVKYHEGVKFPLDRTTTSGSLLDYLWPQEKTVHSFETDQVCPIYLASGV